MKKKEGLRNLKTLEAFKKQVEAAEEFLKLAEKTAAPTERNKYTQEELAELLVLSDVVMKLAKQTNSIMKKALEYEMSTGEAFQLEDYDLVIEKRESKPRKNWDTAKLAPVVAESILEEAIDPETGAVTVPYVVLMCKMFEYASVNYWRVKKLRELDIPVDDYSDFGEKSVSFSITKTTGEEQYDTEDPF